MRLNLLIKFNPYLESLYRGPLHIFSILVSKCSFHNFDNRFTIDIGEKIPPLIVFPCLFVPIRVKEDSKLGRRFVRRFIPPIKVLKERKKSESDPEGYLEV